MENTKRELTPSAGKDGCCNGRRGCFMSRILGLKGLSIIYKAIAIVTLLLLLYSIIIVWVTVFKNPDIPKREAVLTSIGYVINYGFMAFVFYSVGVLFKAVKKIKYAVEHK
ncbi:MAG: hypothetical protein LBG46_03605 [Elusimicrobiota bacterium]|jgi:hypothetical protein|nr:hypothetical protein [Elusimicrobiota bacterium]